MFKQGQFFATKRHVTVHHVSAVALKRCWTLLATDFFYVATLCVVLMHCISSVAGFLAQMKVSICSKGIPCTRGCL